jgi:hypothetical protein
VIRGVARQYSQLSYLKKMATPAAATSKTMRAALQTHALHPSAAQLIVYSILGPPRQLHRRGGRHHCPFKPDSRDLHGAFAPTVSPETLFFDHPGNPTKCLLRAKSHILFSAKL